MSQVGYTPLLVYGSTTAANVPLAANLATGAGGVELAINATDGKLFYKDNLGVVQVMATKSDVVTNQNSATRLLGAVAGTNTITATLTPAITAYVAGQTFEFIATAANTGPVTIAINGLAASPITKNGTVTLYAGDIVAGQVYVLIRDAAGNFQISGGIGGGGATGGGNDTVFNVNKTTVNFAYTIPTGSAANTVGPITFNAAITANGRLVIL